MMRLLSVGPLPPTPSGIADYTADLLPHLAARTELAVAVPDDAPPPVVPYPTYRFADLSAATGRWPRRRAENGVPSPVPPWSRAVGPPAGSADDSESFGLAQQGLREESPPAGARPALAGSTAAKIPRVDLPIYHLGNHRLHAATIELMKTRPGLVVLHDGVLHHLYADVLLARGRGGAYSREAAFDGGVEALARAEAAVAGTAPPAWYEQPMLGRVLRLARGVLVHSRHAEAAARRAYPATWLRVVHHGVAEPPDALAIAALGDEARQRHAIPAGAFVVGSFGGLTAEKRIASVLAGFAALARRRPEAHLLLSGEAAPNVDVATVAREQGILERVHPVGRVTLGEMEALMAACDVCVQLRWPTAGEASGATLRALRLGRPTIVSDCGWFAELPLDAAARISAALDVDAEAAAVSAELAALADDPARRQQLAKGARAYAAACGWPAAADAYVAFARDVLAAGDAAPPGRFLAS